VSIGHEKVRHFQTNDSNHFQTLVSSKYLKDFIYILYCRFQELLSFSTISNGLLSVFCITVFSVYLRRDMSMSSINKKVKAGNDSYNNFTGTEKE
jgi:hypothetical protein